MSECNASNPIYILIRTIPDGGYQLSLGYDKKEIAERMKNEGWRAFMLDNETFIPDLTGE